MAANRARASAELDRRWVAAARLLWLVIAGLGAFLVARFIPIHLRQLSTALDEGPVTLLRFYSLTTQEIKLLQDAGLSASAYAVYMLSLEIAWMLAFIIPAVILQVRKSTDRMALFVSFALLVEGIFTTPLMFITAVLDPVARLPVSILGGLGLAFLISLFHLFPDGRFYPRWTRSLTVLGFLVGPALTIWATRNAARPVNTIFSFIISPVMFFLVTGLAAQAIRYRRVSTPLQRQQTKWVVLSMLLMTIGISLIIGVIIILQAYIRSGWGRLLFLVIGQPVNILAVELLPLSITFAVLRYRLWDIDLIIRRTLLYSLLTASLAVIYLTSVLILQRVVDTYFGGGNTIVTVISTLAVAALFTPLRRRIQDSVDRRFFRQKYNVEQVLAAFGQAQRHEVDLDAITASLLSVIQETIQPERAGLWLKPMPGKNTQKP